MSILSIQRPEVSQEQKLALARKYASRLGMLSVDAPQPEPSKMEIKLAQAALVGGIEALLIGDASLDPESAEEVCEELRQEIWALAGDLVQAAIHAEDVFGNPLRRGDEVAVPLAFANVDGTADAEMATGRIETVFHEDRSGQKVVRGLVRFTDDRGGSRSTVEVDLADVALKALPRPNRGPEPPAGVPVPGKRPAA